MSMDLHLLISCGYNSHNLYSIDIGLHMNTNAGAPGVAISLAERVREGDPAAEDELVARFHRRVYLMGLARTHDEEVARDLAQDVIVGALQGLREGRLINGEKLSAYVHGIARNLVSNFFRTRREQPTGPFTLDNPHEAKRDGAEDMERRTLASEIIADLRPTDRAILRMTLVEGLRFRRSRPTPRHHARGRPQEKIPSTRTGERFLRRKSRK